MKVSESKRKIIIEPEADENLLVYESKIGNLVIIGKHKRRYNEDLCKALAVSMKLGGNKK